MAEVELSKHLERDECSKVEVEKLSLKPDRFSDY